MENRPAYYKTQQGVFTFLASFLLAMSLGAMGVFAVGQTVWEKNRIQGIADMVAMTAARQLANGPIFSEAKALATQNGLQATDTLVIQCVIAGAPTTNCAQAVTARATLTRNLPSLMPFLKSEPTTVVAEATTAPTVTGTVSSGLLSLNTDQSLLLGGILSSLAGAKVNLSLADANGLLGSTVNVDLLKLGLKLNGLTFNELLALRDVKAFDFLVAALSVGDKQDAVAAAVLNNQVKLALRDVRLNVADLLATDLSGRTDTLLLANFGDLVNAVILNSAKGNVLNLDLKALQVGGLSSLSLVDVQLKVIESPQVFVGRKDPLKMPIATGRTAQVQLSVKLGGGLGTIGGLLSVLDVGVQLKAGGGVVEVDDIQCRFPRAQNTTRMSIASSALDLCLTNSSTPMLNTVNGSSCPASAKIVDLPVVGTSVNARLNAISLRSVERDVTVTGVPPFTSKTELNLGRSLSTVLRNADLNLSVTLLGSSILNIATNLLLGGLVDLLAPVLSPILGLVGGVLDSLLALLGIDLNTVTVDVNAVDCQSVRLTR